MPSLISKLLRMILISLVNLLSGTHFFAFKRVLLNAAGIRVGSRSKVVGPIHISTVAQLSIGSDVWVGRNLCVEGDGVVSIGNRVDIAPHCVFSTGGHEIGPSVRRAGTGIIFSQSVEDGCWLGIRCTVLNETIIESGSVVAGGAVVNKDVPKNTLCGGVPARTIRQLKNRKNG